LGSTLSIHFFRPGHVAPNTATGEAGLNAPELQIINESSAINYINFMNAFIYDFSETRSGDPDAGVNADYSEIIGLADDAQALIDRLDLLLTGNALVPEFKTRMLDLMNKIEISATAPDEDRITRVLTAVTMVMTSPGFTVLK